MFDGGVQAGSGAPDELVGRDLALLGENPAAGLSLKRLEKMTKQKLAEVKLSGNLADGDSGLGDR
jgi:hypothetical protein